MMRSISQMLMLSPRIFLLFNVDIFVSQHRGKSDWKNAVYSGCVTGGAIGFRGMQPLFTFFFCKHT